MPIFFPFLYFWSLFTPAPYAPPQPLYQIQYQQALMNYRPAPIVVPQTTWGPPPPQYVVQPPCQVLSPTLVVCP